jgi:non-ribosomal peptide synthase protein (TIGR01720 family)
MNRVELTSEKFLSVFYRSYRTHRTYSSKKTYKTGDLSRWLVDGNIEFLGRIDQQVKIRGFRIELGEIENHLLTHQAVQETVIVSGEDDACDRYLCAYVVSAEAVEKTAPLTEELKEHLSHTLPVYMIPSYFVFMEKFPLTPGHKINRNALPEPQQMPMDRDETISAQHPRNPVEEQLVNCVLELLPIHQVGRGDNFFHIGGDSIKAIQLSARLRGMDLKLEVTDLFSNPVLKDLAQCIQPVKRAAFQGAVEGEVPLTPIQQWFFLDLHEQEELDINRSTIRHFNQAATLYSSDGFDETAVAEVFTRIIIHHDALRMVFKKQGSRIIQFNRGVSQPLFDMDVVDLSSFDEKEMEERMEQEINRLQRSMDLTDGPLVKLGLFKTAEGDHLIIVIHHLVIDGVSWRILGEDFAAGYSSYLNNEEIRFPAKTDAFKYWAEKLTEYCQRPGLLAELEYWRKIEETEIKPLPEDHDVEPEKLKLKYSDTVTLELNEIETGKLLKEVNRAYNTEVNDILLTALGRAVHRWAGIEKVAVELEGHGREKPGEKEDIDVSRTVGWFTTLYPVILPITSASSSTISLDIKTVKETLRAVPAKGIGWGILKYLTPEGKKQGVKFQYAPQIRFNYLGQFEGINGVETDLLDVSGMETGDTISPDRISSCLIDIHGKVIGMRLELSFTYNRYRYEPQTIERLVNSYKANLLEIIKHCVKKEETEKTLSDLTLYRVSDEGEKPDEAEIESIYDALEGLHDD